MTMDGEVDILLVEDNPDDLELTLHALRREHLAIISSSSATAKRRLNFCSARGVLRNAASIILPGWFCSTSNYPS